MEDWLPGYSARELDDAQARYGLKFPPDLISLLAERRPKRGYDWRHDNAAIERAMAHPLDGLLFDLEHNALWWPEWGDRPEKEEERASVLTAIVSAAPRLIPILGHRYIPETPSDVGNPVFSVMQADTIYYGANLADYFQREFNPSAFTNEPMASPIRRIPFWSDLVERNPLNPTEG
jgi:hypothetical protein